MRLVIAVCLLLLALPAVARADLRVTWDRVTNDPVVTFTSDKPVVQCSRDGVTYTDCTSPWHLVVAADGNYDFYVKDDACASPRRRPPSASPG